MLKNLAFPDIAKIEKSQIFHLLENKAQCKEL